MTVADMPPRGALIETIHGKEYLLRLTLAEIELFERNHRGIFAFYDGLAGVGPPATTVEVRDLVALGLVGGGMTAAAADAIMGGVTVADMRHIYQIAQAVLGVAFHPDYVDEMPKKKGKKRTK